jgi:hypothetical protein
MMATVTTLLIVPVIYSYLRAKKALKTEVEPELV